MADLKLLSSGCFKGNGIEVQRAVYNKYYLHVYSNVFYLTKHHEDTEDIIQESFWRIVQRPLEYRSEAELKSWLRVVARNTAYTFLLRNKKHAGNLDIETLNPSLFAISSTEKDVQMRLLLKDIQKLLAQLPQEYQTVLLLRSSGDTYKEMANNMGISEGAVRQKLLRARKKLKAYLSGVWDLK